MDPAACVIQQPASPWEQLQVGNCGPPIETDRGWLVFTHGVGAMRTYSIGAMLLDLDAPATVLGRLERPLLVPQDDARDGYVPNVVYSCGGSCTTGGCGCPTASTTPGSASPGRRWTSCSTR